MVSSAHNIIWAQSLGTLLLQVLSSAFNLANRVIFARDLGPKGFGQLTEVRAWWSVVSLIADLGWGWLLIRTLPCYEVREQWGLYRGLLRRADQVVFSLSCAGALVIAVAGPRISSASSSAPAFWLAALIFPAFVINGLRRSALYGMRQIVTAQLITFIASGPLLLALILFTRQLLTEVSLTPTIAIGLEGLTCLLSLAVLSLLLRRRMPREATAAPLERRTATWLKSAAPMFLLGSMYRLNTKLNLILVGSLLGAASAGFLGVAAEWAGIVTYPLIAVNTALLPHASRLYAISEQNKLQQIVSQSLRGALLFAAMIFVVLLLSGRWLLAIYGPEYVVGYCPLLILAAGQLLLTAVGSVWQLMLATGHEAELFWASIASTLINVLLVALLVPLIQLEGAALAIAGSTLLTALVGVLRLYRTRGLLAAPLNPTRRGKL